MKAGEKKGRRRSIKAEAKLKEEVEKETNNSVYHEPVQFQVHLEDLIICQICKDPVVKDHRMCPHCGQIWCFECIEPCFKPKTAKCPNCRKLLVKNKLKKSPLFEKLRDYLSVAAVPIQQPKGCELHEQPDDFFCKECQVLCCSKCALLSDTHKNHSFTSLEDIYKIKKDQVIELQENLGEFSKSCQKLLEESNINLIRSEDNLKSSKEMFKQRVTAWEDDFCRRFQSNLDSQTQSKTNIESVLDSTRQQKDTIHNLLEHPHKDKLVRRYNDTVDDTTKILVKQEDIKVSEVVDGEAIENHFVPKFTTKECNIKGVDSQTPENTYVYADVFDIVKDKFKFGVKVVKNKKSKSVNICLRISKPNQRSKQYEILLYQQNDTKPMGEFILASEKDKVAETHILHTMSMSNFEKLKSDNDQVIFVLKVRPASYLQIVRDQEDHIKRLENSS